MINSIEEVEIFYCHTRLRKSYIDKTTRTGEQVVKFFQTNKQDAKGGPGVINLTKGFLDLPAI